MDADTQPAKFLKAEPIYGPAGEGFFYDYMNEVECMVIYSNGGMHMKKELVQDIKRPGPVTHPIPYPYCVDKVCELHPWVL